jgi:decaprenylphospho-beta-D-erythro-pentofuranosid-2-ulose 2-reductase
MKNILILGAGSDMAIPIARMYSSHKNRIMLASRNPLVKLQEDLRIRYNNEVYALSFDALDYASHPEFYKNLPLIPDIVICFFGYLGDQKKAEKEWEEAQRIIDTNYKGAVSILNVAGHSMELQKTGIIVGVSSVAGERGRQSNYIYGSAKAGFSTFLQGLRNKLFHSNVHVMTVKPGFVDTKMTEGLNTPRSLTASPEQVAKAIIKGIEAKKNVVYVLGIWRLIMLVIKLIPEFIFKKLKM